MPRKKEEIEGKYRLGVDVGGTFTDLLLIDSRDSSLAAKMKVPSTPHDSSIGVQDGITKICAKAGITQSMISTVFHGTTVATNAVLEGKGVKVGLITSEGYRQVLHIGRSFVPGGLAGWIIWNRQEDLAPLECTIEASERIGSKGEVVTPLDEAALKKQLIVFKDEQVEAITVSLFNSYLNPVHEQRVRELCRQYLPNLPVSISSEVLPEMYEYERALTTVTNSYIRPNVSNYMKNLQTKLGNTDLRVLRSDGGLCSGESSSKFPVNLLMSGPAGGVAGALWVSEKSGFRNVITLDMGGTSTDVAVIHDGVPKTRRETKVGDVTVRATSMDVHTVGAGGGSIAHVPDLTKALRVGPQSAGARPGPACYGHGGTEATVTDANIVLGYLPSVLLGGAMKLDVEASHKAVQAVADKLGVSKHQCAAGIIDIVNENMVGAIRTVSIEKGHDPREFALCAFGGGGGLQANAVGVVMDSWPVIVPPSPGVLCAYGDATTRARYEQSRAFVHAFEDIDGKALCDALRDLADKATAGLVADRVPLSEQKVQYMADLRYKGQGLTMPVEINLKEVEQTGLSALAAQFDADHKKLFHFSFNKDHEVVNLRAVAQSGKTEVRAPQLKTGPKKASPEARTGSQEVYMNGKMMTAGLWDRSLLLAGNEVAGPAIICEFDSTTLVLAGHTATIDPIGNILIRPTAGEQVAAVVADSVTLDVIENALRHSRFEMDAVVFRSAMSPGIREQHDQFPMICDAAGKMVVGQFGSFITGFLKGYNQPIVDGDIILLSDPYSCEGAISHANDWMVLTPIFVEPNNRPNFPKTKLVGWAAMFGHTTDIGGKSPCSMPNDAQTIYEEGIVIPPVKLYSEGKLNDDMLKLILHNCRKPIWNHCDLMALVASIQVGRDRVQELCSRFGHNTYCKALDEMLARNRTAMAQLIHDSVGTEPLYFEDYICDDAMGSGPYKIACTMWREGESNIVFDFNGTDPQSKGSANFYMNEEMFKMFMGSYMIMVFDPQIIFNDGFYDLVDVRIPLGSLLKPKFPAALSCRTHALGRIFDILGGLLGQRAPQFMTAAGFSDSPHFMYSGTYEETGEWYQLYSISFGGIPGRPFGDGPDGHSLWPSFSNVPNEFLEQYFPLRVEAMYTIPDSGGAGRYRGGNGINAVYRFLEDGAVSNHDDRWLTHPWGVNGGTPGMRSTKILYRGCPDGTLTGGVRCVVPSKGDNIKVKRGDVLHYITWGGGGWGRPEQREPEKVLKDVKQGLVTVEGALRYGVKITETTRSEGRPLLSVDEEATTALRAVMEKKPDEMFDFGFKKQIKATAADMRGLLTSCLEETGLPAPELPVGGSWPGLTIPKHDSENIMPNTVTAGDKVFTVHGAGAPQAMGVPAAFIDKMRADQKESRSEIMELAKLQSQTVLQLANTLKTDSSNNMVKLASTLSRNNAPVVVNAPAPTPSPVAVRPVTADRFVQTLINSGLNAAGVYAVFQFLKTVLEKLGMGADVADKLPLLGFLFGGYHGLSKVLRAYKLLIEQKPAPAAVVQTTKLPPTIPVGRTVVPTGGSGKLAGKVALITGSSSGIGKAVAIHYAKEGAAVVVNYPTGFDDQKKSAEEIVKGIQASGGKAIAVAADVSDQEEVKLMVEETVAEFGRIDILVNNAGIASMATCENMEASMWDQMIRINLRSVFLCTNAVLPLMYAQNSGKIICTTSQLAYKGAPGFAHYCACKGAILSFVRSIALEIGSRAININCVAPGATATPILGDVQPDVLKAIVAGIPRGKMAEVDDIWPAYVFLASDDSSHFVGQCLSPNGGDVFL